MIKIHPDFLNEQEYINEAYSILERAHDEAKKLHKMVESGRGGTHQARFEKDVISLINTTVLNMALHLNYGL